MKLTLESSDIIQNVNGTPCRVWTGTTERGVAVVAFITLLRVERGQDLAQFERELAEVHPSGVNVPDVIPLKFIL